MSDAWADAFAAVGIVWAFAWFWISLIRALK